MHFSQWIFLDYFFAAIVLVSTAFAAVKGLAREIISLVAMIGGFILAVLYYRVPAGWLAEFSRTESVADLLGFLSIFVGCILIGVLVTLLVNRFVKAAKLTWIDRLLGAVFGFLRGWAISSIVVVAFIAFPVRENLMVRSHLAPFLLAGARTAVLLVPQGLKDKFNEEYKKVLHDWNQNRSGV